MIKKYVKLLLVLFVSVVFCCSGINYSLPLVRGNIASVSNTPILSSESNISSFNPYANKVIFENAVNGPEFAAKNVLSGYIVNSVYDPIEQK